MERRWIKYLFEIYYHKIQPPRTPSPRRRRNCDVTQSPYPCAIRHSAASCRLNLLRETKIRINFFFQFLSASKFEFWVKYLEASGPGSSVGIAATGWTVRGSNPGGDEIFRTCPDRPWGPPSLPYNGYRVFPGGKERPGRDADPSPPSSAVVKKE